MRHASRKAHIMTGAIVLLSVLLLAAISGCDARRIGLNDDDDDDDDENKIPKPLVTTSILSSDDGAAEILGLDKGIFIAIVAGISGGLLVLILLSGAVFCVIKRCRHRMSPTSKFFSDYPLLDEACKPSDEDIDAVQHAAQIQKGKSRQKSKPEIYVGEAYVQMPDHGPPSEVDGGPAHRGQIETTR